MAPKTKPVKKTPSVRTPRDRRGKAARRSAARQNGINPAHGVVEPLTIFVRWTRLRSYELIARQAGISIDRSAITILGNLFRSGPIRMSDLASMVGLDRSTISRQIVSVVKAGYVQKVEDRSDGRATLLSLTREGQAIRRKLDDAWHAVAMRLVDDWSVEDQLHLGRLLSRIAHRMREDGGL